MQQNPPPGQNPLSVHPKSRQQGVAPGSHTSPPATHGTHEPSRHTVDSSGQSRSKLQRVVVVVVPSVELVLVVEEEVLVELEVLEDEVVVELVVEVLLLGSVVVVVISVQTE